MGWLLGLPLGLFRMLGSFFMLLLRFGIPVLLVVLLVWLWRRQRAGGSGDEKDPDFDGPVYTVDYEEVDEKEDPDDEESSAE